MIKKAKPEDCLIVAKLAKELWNNHSLVDLEKEFKEYLFLDSICIYIDYENSTPVAFAQVSLGNEYVEGVKLVPLPTWKEFLFMKNIESKI